MSTSLKNNIVFDLKINALLKAHHFCDAAIQLHSMQKKEWRLLSDNFNSLKQARLKSFQFDGYKIYCQFNSQRVISTSADVSDGTIKNRNCFLCIEHLPEEQKGILIKDKFILLCNPYPIFKQHFTIALISHLPQLIEDYFSDLLSLAKNLTDRFVIFYNGPKCGASAPDHLHFQAGEKVFLPIFEQLDFIKDKFGKLLVNITNFSAYSVNDGLRKFILMESPDQQLMIKYFHKIYAEMKKNNSDQPELMLNILCRYEEKNGWAVLIFPRSQHRSSHYFKEEENKILISPASVDLGGVCILPREEDFTKMKSSLIEEIFSEIFPSKDEFDKIISTIF